MIDKYLRLLGAASGLKRQRLPEQRGKVHVQPRIILDITAVHLGAVGIDGLFGHGIARLAAVVAEAVIVAGFVALFVRQSRRFRDRRRGRSALRHSRCRGRLGTAAGKDLSVRQCERRRSQGGIALAEHLRHTPYHTNHRRQHQQHRRARLDSFEEFSFDFHIITCFCIWSCI